MFWMTDTCTEIRYRLDHRYPRNSSSVLIKGSRLWRQCVGRCILLKGKWQKCTAAVQLWEVYSGWHCFTISPGVAFVYIQSIHWIPSKSRLWLYCNVFHKSDLWQDINDTILLFFSAKIANFWAIDMKVFKTQLEYFCTQLLRWCTVIVSWVCSNVLLCSSWVQKCRVQSWTPIPCCKSQMPHLTFTAGY